MATKTKSKRASVIHKVTVVGIYSASGGENGKLFQRPYEETFLIRDEQHKKDGALSIFKHCRAEQTLRAKDPNYVGLLEHNIKETRSSGHDLPTDVSLMNRQHLLSYIDQEELEVNATLYEDVADLQQAVMDAEEDPASYAKAQAHIEKSRARRPGGTFRDDLDELNNNFDAINAELFGDEQQEDEPVPTKLSTIPVAASIAKPTSNKVNGKFAKKVDADESPV